MIGDRTCEELCNDLIDGRLGTRAEQAFMEHYDRCSACQTYIDRLTSLEKMFGELDVPSAPHRIREHISVVARRVTEVSSARNHPPSGSWLAVVRFPGNIATWTGRRLGILRGTCPMCGEARGSGLLRCRSCQEAEITDAAFEAQCRSSRTWLTLVLLLGASLFLAREHIVTAPLTETSSVIPAGPVATTPSLPFNTVPPPELMVNLPPSELIQYRPKGPAAGALSPAGMPVPAVDPGKLGPHPLSRPAAAGTCRSLQFHLPPFTLIGDRNAAGLQWAVTVPAGVPLEHLIDTGIPGRVFAASPDSLWLIHPRGDSSVMSMDTPVFCDPLGVQYRLLARIETIIRSAGGSGGGPAGAERISGITFDPGSKRVLLACRSGWIAASTAVPGPDGSPAAWTTLARLDGAELVGMAFRIADRTLHVIDRKAPGHVVLDPGGRELQRLPLPDGILPASTLEAHIQVGAMDSRLVILVTYIPVNLMPGNPLNGPVIPGVMSHFLDWDTGEVTGKLHHPM